MFISYKFLINKDKGEPGSDEGDVSEYNGGHRVVLAMLLMYREFGTLDFSTLSGLSGTDAPHMKAICLLLMGAVGKSAQLGLHT